MGEKVVKKQFRKGNRAFPSGTVDKNEPANAEDTGLTPDPEIFHKPRSN